MRGSIIGNNMNSKRIQAIKFYLMTLSEKQYVIKSLPDDVRNQLLQYTKELDAIIPKDISAGQKGYLLEEILKSGNSDNLAWLQFAECVSKKMAYSGIFPTKLRQAVMEL